MSDSNNKKINGVVYTPKWIVEKILDFINYKGVGLEEKKIIDPSCGEGAFLEVAVDRLITSAKKNGKENKEIKKCLENNIFGFDIDNKAINKCKKNLSDKAMSLGINDVRWNNIISTDSMDSDKIKKFFGLFDYVVGNPPYVRIQNLGKERRKKIQESWSFCQSGSTDIFITFFEVGFNLLSESGSLGYITPNTYLKTYAGKNLRIFLRRNKFIKSLIDFGHHQIFENVTTYSLITIASKNSSKNLFDFYRGDNNNINLVGKIDIRKLGDDNWILASQEILDRIDYLENRGIPLKNIAKIHVGITTLADNLYIFKNVKINGGVAEIKLRDGRKFNIESDILKPIVKVSVLKNSKEDQQRFIIFPYKKEGGKNVIISENEMIEKFPLTFKYFLSVRNLLDKRDKGKQNPVSWYAFGRSQGLDTSFGKKILTSPIGKSPNFMIWEKEDFTFYSGYCIKFDGDLNWLAKQLNSNDLDFYIRNISRDYQNNYKSFAKSFLEKFSIVIPDGIKTKSYQQEIF